MVRRPSLHDSIPRRQELLGPRPFGQEKNQEAWAVSRSRKRPVSWKKTRVVQIMKLTNTTLKCLRTHHTHTPTPLEQHTLLSWAGNQPEIGR